MSGLRAWGSGWVSWTVTLEEETASLSSWGRADRGAIEKVDCWEAADEGSWRERCFMFRREPARLARGKGRGAMDALGAGAGASSAGWTASAVWIATVSAATGLRGVSAVLLGAAERVAGEASRSSEGWESAVGSRLAALAAALTEMRRPEGGPFLRGRAEAGAEAGMGREW